MIQVIKTAKALSFGQGLSGLGLGSLLVVLVLALGGGEAKGEKGGTASGLNCGDRRLVDYEKPLRQMRPIPRIPASNQLPFGPPGLRLSRIRRPVFVGPAVVGFALFNMSTKRSNGWQGWSATTVLSTVDRAGRTLQKVRSERQGVVALFRGRVEHLILGESEVSSRPRFYRLEVVFKHRDKRVGRYAEYLKALPQRNDVRLGINRAVIHPGEGLVWRVENYGTTIVEFGRSYKVERYTADGWIIDPITPTGFPQDGYYMGAGSAGPCQSLSLPIDMEPGRYRLTKDIFAADKPRDIRAIFDVVP